MATTSVDYRDFLLVFKAFHLKENAPNGMICRCGLKKEDTVFFNGEETSIPSYDNTFNQYIEENIGSWGSFSRDSFQIETIMVPTCDDDVSSIEKLKNIFLDMSPYKRLVWCGRLLIEFHEENQCSRYLSSALKFYLKAIEYMRSVPFCGIVPIDSKIKELLRLSTKFRVHQSVFLELFRLFIAFECDHSINAVLLLEHLFRAANEFKIDMFALWNKKDITNTSRYYYFFNFLIYRADEFLIQIIKFGKTECISIESRRYLRYLLNELNDYNWGHLDIHVKNDYRYNSTTFRALQTLCLFHRAKFGWDPAKGSYALKLLWNSITEPFLCQEEFKKSVIAFWERGPRVLIEAWEWYVSHVLENVISPKGPRSLVHLSRCSVRRQLATCFQLPCGVEHLDVTRNLKGYILLEH